MGFSIKLAPGIRVRASSRGVRTSLGPRVARVHVGAGGTGISTGLGPVGYYTRVGGSSRGNSSHRVNQSLAATSRQQANADKAAEAQRLEAAFAALLSLHRETFPVAQRGRVAPPPEPPSKQLRSLYRAEARTGSSVFDRGRRRQALALADQRAAAAVTEARTEIARQAAAQQTRLDTHWSDLLACAPDAVLMALAQAFEDNEAAASAVGIEDKEVSLVVIVPPISHVPERKPAVTKAGNLSLKKLTKTETADLYKQLVFGHLLVTLREAFAVAPGLESARVVAVRPSDPDAHGRSSPEVLAAVSCARSSLAGVLWEQADAVQVVNDCCTETILVQKGVTRALQPVPLAAEPELRALLDAVDVGELPD